MQKWYVVQVLSGQEKKTRKTIEEQRESHGMAELITEIMLPTERVSDVKGGEQRIVERKLWPGYLLLKMDLTDDSWLYVKNCNGVIEFLGGAQPTSLTDKEVEEILRDLESKKEIITHRHKFEVGDHVKITDGVFVNFTGTVTEVFHEKGRLSVLVSIFGRETRVDDLEFSSVEEMNEESEVG